MAQLSPSTLHYGQLMALVQEFELEYKKGTFKTAEEVIEEIKDIMRQFNEVAGQPLLELEAFELGEPTQSAKMNRVWRMLESDVNIVQDQLNILRAAVIFLHNFIATEIQLAKNQNAQASNKLKTMQLYSIGQNSNLITFGDYFSNLDFVDLQSISSLEKVSHLGPGIVSLGRQDQAVNASSSALVKVLDTSNGFSGVAQEINDPTAALVNPADDVPIYVFRAQTEGLHASLASVIDDEPNTWFEYESNYVTPQDRLKAKDLNFVYKKDGTAQQTNSSTDQNNANQGLVDWAKGPVGGVLKLNLEFDLKTIKKINTISYTPFGLENNKNAPVKVKLVQTSSNGTDWEPLYPQNLWVATDANLQTARVAENVVIGTAMYSFDERNVRFVRMSIEQTQSIDANIGHLYYETNKTVVSETRTVPDPDNPGQTKVITVEVAKGGDRVEGPIPPLNQPNKYYSNNGLVSGNLVQRVEYFQGKRWAIGIRDILIQESKYRANSVLISKPFRIAGVVDRVSLEADTFIPPNFPTDQGDLWIKFYVSPNDGLNWYPISRIQDDYLGIPEVIAFNDPLPSEFREPGVYYVNTSSVVNSLRVKIELSRPEDLISSTPIVRSYKLKVVKR